jgi:nitrate/nitrite-specific signal transduction histidine kinase
MLLRRKLLTRLGLLVAAFVLGAVGALWALQSVMDRVDHANADAASLIDGILRVGGAVNAVEASADAPAPARDDAAKRLRTELDSLGRHPVAAARGPAAPAYAKARDTLDAFLQARSPDANLRMQSAVQDLALALRTHVAQEQALAGRNFRLLVLALTLAALIMVNVAVLVLLHTARSILRPVTALVEGSRQLAAERFDHRVNVPDTDEFGELAHAYNSLAAQLASNEERKTQTLRQLAVTLNHDLNNAMAIIELQLALLDRQAAGSPAHGDRLRDIRAALSRMAGLVASLKNIRRVVLTDYGPGQQMVDLEKSLADDPPTLPPTGVDPR